MWAWGLSDAVGACRRIGSHLSTTIQEAGGANCSGRRNDQLVDVRLSDVAVSVVQQPSEHIGPRTGICSRPPTACGSRTTGASSSFRNPRMPSGYPTLHMTSKPEPIFYVRPVDGGGAPVRFPNPGHRVAPQPAAMNNESSIAEKM